jgi:hypothetical protein
MNPKNAHGVSEFDRRAPRKPRPEGRGRGELYKNVPFPYREAPPGRAGRLHFLRDHQFSISNIPAAPIPKPMHMETNPH